MKKHVDPKAKHNAIQRRRVMARHPLVDGRRHGADATASRHA